MVIFSITAIKELLDDIGRRREDKAANRRKYTVVRDGKSEEVQYSDTRRCVQKLGLSL